MKNNYYINVFGILLLIVLFGILPFGMIAHAEGSTYETLEIKLPYKHIYTTTDVRADSVFHYSIFAKDDAPLPVEAAENGVFSFNGVSGNGIEEENKNVFNLEGNLTFEFTKPGIYYYDIKSDSETDEKKKNASYYTLNSKTITIAFYINSPDKNKMNLKMITVQSNDDVKINEIVLEAKYIEPETTSSENSSKSTFISDTSSIKTNSEISVTSKSNTISSVTVTSNSDDITNPVSTSHSLLERTFKTGDESNKLFYVILMTLSVAIIFIISVLSYKKVENIEE